MESMYNFISGCITKPYESLKDKVNSYPIQSFLIWLTIMVMLITIGGIIN